MTHTRQVLDDLRVWPPHFFYTTCISKHFKPTLNNIISTEENQRLLSSKHPESYYYQLVLFTTFIFGSVLSYSQVCVMAVWGTLSHPSISSNEISFLFRLTCWKSTDTAAGQEEQVTHGHFSNNNNNHRSL
ncbi:hypothetical protein BDV19DRAFT_198040 [Aspergillus venezuelensis]